LNPQNGYRGPVNSIKTSGVPGRWGRTGVAWATLALAVARAIEALEDSSGAGVQLTDLRSVPGRQAVRFRAILANAGSLETVSAEVAVPIPADQIGRAIRPAIAFLDAAALGGGTSALSRPSGLRMPTSRRRDSRQTKRTSRRIR